MKKIKKQLNHVRPAFWLVTVTPMANKSVLVLMWSSSKESFALLKGGRHDPLLLDEHKRQVFKGMEQANKFIANKTGQSHFVQVKESRLYSLPFLKWPSVLKRVNSSEGEAVIGINYETYISADAVVDDQEVIRLSEMGAWYD